MQILINKPAYLGILILQLSKTLMYEFQYDCVKPKYGEKELCYMNADSFIVYINSDDIYKDIAEDVETSFDYQLDRPLPKAKKSESNWINEK